MGAEGVRRVSADLSGKRTEQIAEGPLKPSTSVLQSRPIFGAGFFAGWEQMINLRGKMSHTRMEEQSKL